MNNREQLRELIEQLDDQVVDEAVARVRRLATQSVHEPFDFGAAFARAMVSPPTERIRMPSKEFKLGDEVYALANDMCAVWAKATVDTVTAVLEEYERWRQAQ